MKPDLTLKTFFGLGRRTLKPSDYWVDRTCGEVWEARRGKDSRRIPQSKIATDDGIDWRVVPVAVFFMMAVGGFVWACFQ